MRFETLAVHAGGEADRETGAVAPPIHLSTTFLHWPESEPLHGRLYQREGNPTQDRLEAALGIGHALRHPRRDRLGNTLDFVPAQVAQTEQIAEQPAR